MSPTAALDRENGYREYGPCADCGGMRYQFFDRATWSWTTGAAHKDENCIQYLRKRIEALEASR